jgi:diacylglycerol kinase (ATP)
MSRKILYLVNPISGTQAKSSLEDFLTRKTWEQKIDLSILSTAADGNYQFLVKKIQDDKISDVVICGGDGTVSAIASALRGIRVNIGIIPMGSGNGLAFAAKIPKSINKALGVIFQGKSSFIDAFYINNQFSCMLCGIGFDARVAEEFSKQKRRGLQTYIKVSVIQFFKARPYVFEIELKERSFTTEAFFISIANGNQFGNHFTIAPKASLKDGLLDIVIVKKMNKFTLPFSVIGQMAGINAIRNIGDPIEKGNILYFQSDALTIRNDELAPLHIDGDPTETAPEFKIRIVRDGLCLLQP